METGENHEKIVFKTSKIFLTKMHYVRNVEFYKHANLQVETQNCFAAMEMTNSVMNSSKMNSSSARYYSLLILSFLLLLIVFEFQLANLHAYRTLCSQHNAYFIRIF